MIEMNEDDLMDTTKYEVFRIIVDILTRKVLHNKSAIDVTGELQNWKQSFVVRQDVRDLLPEDDNCYAPAEQCGIAQYFGQRETRFPKEKIT